MIPNPPSSERTFRNLKLRLAISNVVVLFAFLGIFAGASAPQDNGDSNQVQDYKISTLQETATNNSRRITDLEHDVWVWKGAVMGFGALITFMELLQMLGVVRYPQRERSASKRRSEQDDFFNGD